KERELVFRIEPGTASWYNGLPRGVQEFDLPFSTPGGVQRIHSWWWPAAAHNAPAVLYLHGSRWNLTGQLFRISQLHDFGFSVLAIDYRGFGKSEGELPSENSVYADARAAWERLTELQHDPARRFIYGHSLGGAVAVDLAHALSSEAQHAGRAVPAAGLIVESSFTSLAQLAAELTATRWPIRWLLSQKFNSIDKIAAVHMPVLVVHGKDDRYVPARFSEALYDAATEPKRLLLVAHANHNNSMRLGSADYGKALQELFGLGKETRKAV
ncbi:MAG TPA: alpha/beta fold hydrolase, partial [Burkholderiales bacterium]|nr:alpha/beta fold hydrolase [Burkholderiales bacterium]